MQFYNIIKLSLAAAAVWDRDGTNLVMAWEVHRTNNNGLLLSFSPIRGDLIYCLNHHCKQ